MKIITVEASESLTTASVEPQSVVAKDETESVPEAKCGGLEMSPARYCMMYNFDTLLYIMCNYVEASEEDIKDCSTAFRNYADGKLPEDEAVEIYNRYSEKYEAPRYWAKAVDEADEVSAECYNYGYINL